MIYIYALQLEWTGLGNHLQELVFARSPPVLESLVRAGSYLMAANASLVPKSEGTQRRVLLWPDLTVQYTVSSLIP